MIRQAPPSARRVVACVLLAATMLGLLAAPGHAYHSDRYRQLQREISRTRDLIREATRKEESLLARIADSDRRRAVLDRRLSVLGDQLAVARDRLALTISRIDRATAELAAKTAELEHALGLLAEQRQRLDRRAMDVYIMGPLDHTQIILGARDMQSLVAGFEYARTVLDWDSRLLDEVRATKERIEDARLAIVSRKSELEKARAEQQSEAARIGAIRTQETAARNGVVREIGYRQRLLSEVRTEKEAYRRALQSYVAESQSLSAFLRGAQRGQKVIAGYGGYLKWPVSGTITSGYGWRNHPLWGYRSFHTGIDIAAPTGTIVKAARAGEVLFTGYKGAYGLMAVIDHGNSIATVYAHLQRVFVRPGEHVGTLEAVGTIGCTGWCTGPHLHFEVRVNGEPQNPLNWL